MQEYPIRRGMIIEDPSLYGAEKEKKLDALKLDMWGEGGEAVDAAADPLNRYTEKLRIYSKDLADLKTDEDRQAEIRRFREECFSQEQIQRFDAMDRSVAQETSKEGDYRKGEAVILNDGRLSDAEKTEKIRSLQDRLFGSEADAFRRRLIIERGDATRAESAER
jgi:lipase chaperone LimK